MDQSLSQTPGPSGVKRKRKSAFTTQQTLDLLDESDDELHYSQNYPESDLESVSDSDDDENNEFGRDPGPTQGCSSIGRRNSGPTQSSDSLLDRAGDASNTYNALHQLLPMNISPVSQQQPSPVPVLPSQQIPPVPVSPPSQQPPPVQVSPPRQQTPPVPVSPPRQQPVPVPVSPPRHQPPPVPVSPPRQQPPLVPVWTADGLATDWTATFHPTGIDLSFDEEMTGPNGFFLNEDEFDSEEQSPLDFLMLVWDVDFWQKMTRLTNLRATQMLITKPDSYYAKLFPPAITVDEMKAFWGLRLYMEYIVIKKSYRDYWNKESQDPIGFTPGFGNVMKRDRFLGIWSFLHMVDEEDPAVIKTDKIYKVRPMFTYFLLKARQFFLPGRYLSLDEGMIPTKNRLSIKQYIKDKPTKWGIKSFLCTDAETGYICAAEIYTGSEAIVEPKLGAVSNTCIRLLRSCNLLQNHILVMDRYYNSVSLADYLLKVEKTGVVGTIQVNRKFFPIALKGKKFRNRGESMFRCRESITCVVWQDKKAINFISNYSDPTDVTEVGRRQKDGTLNQVPCPSLVKTYNTYMGGCDKNDQLTRLYRCRKHYKWPRRLMVKIFMWGVYNAYVLQKKSEVSVLSFTDHIRKISQLLIGSYSAGNPGSANYGACRDDIRLQPGTHFPVVPNDASGNNVCVVCLKKHKNFTVQHPGASYKDNPFKKVKTTIACTQCNVFLCIKKGSDCWQKYHEKVQYWR